MATFETVDQPTREELGWELAEIFDELDVEQINEVLAKNVPLETLKFFAAYASDFGETQEIRGDACKRLANLLLLGYLLRIVEDRLVDEPETFDS